MRFAGLGSHGFARRKLGGAAFCLQGRVSANAFFATVRKSAPHGKVARVRNAPWYGPQILHVGMAFGDGGQKPARIRVQRIVDDIANATHLDDSTGVHHRHTLSVFRNNPHVVRDEEDRGAGLARHLFEDGKDLRLHGDIEGGGRLIGYD